MNQSPRYIPVLNDAHTYGYTRGRRRRNNAHRALGAFSGGARPLAMRTRTPGARITLALSYAQQQQQSELDYLCYMRARLIVQTRAFIV